MGACHQIQQKTFKKPHSCCVCNKSVWLKPATGKCKECKLRMHLRCQPHLKQGCGDEKDRQKTERERKNASGSTDSATDSSPRQQENNKSQTSIKPTIKETQEKTTPTKTNNAQSGEQQQQKPKNKHLMNVPSILVRQPSDPTLPKPENSEERFYTKVIETHKISEKESVNEETIINQYKVVKTIGKGAFGVVYRVTNMDDGVDYAMKMMSKSHLQKKKMGGFFQEEHSAMDDLKREIAILKRLDHPNIVRLYEVLDDPENDCLYMVFELADGVIMDMKNGRAEKCLTEDETRIFFRQLVSGIEYLHNVLIIHRDLKPDNLLIKNGILKICDFGVSESLSLTNTKLTKSIGSTAFFAPEMCSANNDEAFEGQPVDIWAMGVTLYCLLVGEIPFLSSAPLELFSMICDDEPMYPNKLSKNCKSLLSGLLTKDASRRLTLEQIKEHPWVTDEGKDEFSQEDITVPIKTESGTVLVTEAEKDTSLTPLKIYKSFSGSISVVTPLDLACDEDEADKANEGLGKVKISQSSPTVMDVKTKNVAVEE